MKKRPSGFTVVELMITLAVAAALMALAAPSFRDFIIDSRMSGDANEFLTLLNFSRAEAVKRNVRVTMCKSANATSCTTTGGWEQGWISFVDVDPAGTTGVVDAVTACPNCDTILRVHPALAPGDTLVGDTDVASYVSFIPDGRSQLANGSAQAGAINLCASGSTKGRQLTIALGRAQSGLHTC